LRIGWLSGGANDAQGSSRFNCAGFAASCRRRSYRSAKTADFQKTEKTHIVVLTGMTNELFKQSVLTEGVDAYLQKPYDSQVLLDTINAILNPQKNLSGPEAPNIHDNPEPQEATLFDYAASRNQPAR
jgi:DNA-binding response OmpR family regulator